MGTTECFWENPLDIGGILHLFDFNQASMSQKMLTHKRHVDGLEAPRNSLELPIEISLSYIYKSADSFMRQRHTRKGVGSIIYGGNLQLMYSYQVKQNSSKNNCYPSETSMKKLIDEEISKRPDARYNVPSVVARLMGVDTLPLNTKLAIPTGEKKNENAGNNFPRKEQAEKGSIGRSPLGSKPFKQIELDLLPHSKERNTDPSSSSLKFGKPRPREHPQEEQLQKFKKEFEAWQAARVWEHSRVVELGNIPRQWLAQENLNKEKMALYDSRRTTSSEKPIELKGHTSSPTLKARSQESGGSQQPGYKTKMSQANQKESSPSRNRSITSEFEQVPSMICDQKHGKSSMPTRIVILKPGPSRSGGSEESWTSSSEIVEEEGSIEDFLEEVKERLRCEMQGKSVKRETVVRGGLVNPCNEKSSDPKQIAQHIAKHVRESVTRDLGMNLLRSESTRSYRSEIQVNGPGSPEFINRDTRKFLSERLRNVLKRETHMDAPTMVSGSSRASMLDNEGGRVGPTGDVLKTGNRTSYWENVKDVTEMQTRSFRHGPDNDEILYKGEVSPRNLIRSLSAPVSGTSFGKLLLEDRHILTGAHIRRKHEATENVSVEVSKTRKERFSFRGKVSNFRYSFTLRGKLFGRKIQSVEELGSNKFDSVKDIMSGPTVVMNFGNTHENSTEVPPSPASVCSSAHEEFCRPADHSSPISTLDAPLIEDHTTPHVFREISSNLHELRRQLNQLEFNGSEDMGTEEEEQSEAEMIELVGQEETFIRDLLIASGLYNGTSDRFFSSWDSLAKPISNWVFEEVEESYRKKAKENEGAAMDHSESKVDHKALFGLLNEALSSILGPPMTISRFKRKILGPTLLPPPSGKKLLDAVWQMIRVFVYPPMDGSCYSLDSILARDLGTIHWPGMMHNDADMVGRELEFMILGELIEESVKDMRL
ncbi:hypothetical protein HHK36_010459 [Tetracentron sinense]|uniref:DUF4378 domain-containing protein n=1 Tax=Tetracentron sinense TaxID=13715 RepID=A0A834ZEX4_TETSI|nr:hypothetical protein HHK36_010459 [Tetracentron sinense]